MNCRQFLSFFIAMHSFIYASSDDTKSLILKSRTDQDDVKSVQSIRCSKELEDAVLHAILKEAPKLEIIVAQKNLLQKPHPVRCAFLHTINFSNGTITAFPIGDWVTVMPHLKSLNLARNKIAAIASDTDRVTVVDGRRRESWHSSSLRNLDLSHNRLTEFDLCLFNNMLTLEKADFSHNMIAQIQTPRELEHRTVCNVLLQHNQLSQDHKNTLQKLNLLDTKQYEAAQRIGLYAGSATGLVLTGVELLMLLPHALKNDVGILTGVCIGAAFIVPCGTIALGYGIASIIMLSKYTCTYRPLTLMLDEHCEEKDDSVEIEIGH